MIGDPGLHRGSEAQAGMDPAEVVNRRNAAPGLISDLTLAAERVGWVAFASYTTDAWSRSCVPHEMYPHDAAWAVLKYSDELA
jgi:hypothetical protein